MEDSCAGSAIQRVHKLIDLINDALNGINYFIMLLYTIRLQQTSEFKATRNANAPLTKNTLNSFFL